MTTTAQRAMTSEEAALLGAMLSFDIPGAPAYREQARSLLVTVGCRCGCGTHDRYQAGDR